MIKSILDSVPDEALANLSECANDFLTEFRETHSISVADIQQTGLVRVASPPMMVMLIQAFSHTIMSACIECETDPGVTPESIAAEILDVLASEQMALLNTHRAVFNEGLKSPGVIERLKSGAVDSEEDMKMVREHAAHNPGGVTH